jgi:tripartite-type tricarboxylate transporter receptor subunit TctC
VIAKKINADVNAALALPDVQERLDASGAEDGGGTPEKFAGRRCGWRTGRLAPP